MSIRDNYDQDFVFIPKVLDAIEKWGIKGGRYYTREEIVALLREFSDDPLAVRFIADVMNKPEIFAP